MKNQQFTEKPGAYPAPGECLEISRRCPVFSGAFFALKILLLAFGILTIFSARSQTGSWPEVFNPFQVVTLHFELDPDVWDQIRHDTNYYDPDLNIRAQALMWAEGETNKLIVEIRRKSDAALPSESNPQKVSLKVDINQFVAGQEWRGLRKLSLENGGGGNGVLREGLAMNLHRLASEHGFYDYEAGYASWVRVMVNSNYVGLYSSPEQRDKQFMRNHGMYKPGASWLYEVNAGTFLDTTVATTNSPTYNYLCFSPFRTACSQPNDPTVALAMENALETWVDMRGMLTLAAIESFIGNTDGLFTKNGKNSFAADFLPSTQHKRRYYPWDLDAGFSSTTLDIYTGGPGQLSSRKYQVDILGHYWFRQYYRHVFSDLLDGPLSPAVLTDFVNRLEPVLAPYLEEDPNSGGASQFGSVRQYFTNRAANIRIQLGAVTAPPRFNQMGGEIVPGFQLQLTHTNAAGAIYYTVNGTDPRALGGSVAGQLYSGALTLTNTTHVMARVLNGTNWSALRQATFNVAGHANGIKVTEIMYNPKPPNTNTDAGDYEFIELQNRGAMAVNLSGCRLTGVQYAFAPGTLVAPGQFIVLVKNPVAFAARYPGVAFHGVYWGGLASGGEKIRLKNSDGNNIFSVEYDDDPPWPQGANGFGCSLVNINPDGDPDNPNHWRASAAVHGSPGAEDPAPPYTVGVVVNEVITHTDTPLEDAIELHNPTASPINIGGWYLSDQMTLSDPARASLKKFRIPGGTLIPAGGYKTFYESDFNPGTSTTNNLVKFAFGKFGEEVWLSSADAAGNLTGHIVGWRFGAADNGVAIGRHVTSAGTDFTFLAQHTFGVSSPASKEQFRTGAGAPNSAPLIGPVIINEIMYHPTNGGTEFVELYNAASTNVDLGGWTLKGAAYVFPTNTVLPSNGYLVVIDSQSTTPEQFRVSHAVPESVPVLGNLFVLQNDGENLELRKPNDDALGPPILVDRVRYNDKSPWPTEADGFGPSLERIAASAYGNEPLNWRTAKTGGSPGRAGAFTNGIAVAKNSSWKYQAAGFNLGAPWRETAYSDSGWQDGDGPLGYGFVGAKTLLVHSPGNTNRPVTTYLRKEFVINESPAGITSLTLRANYDDGFIAYLNGQEVARRSMPGGTISFDTPANVHDGGTYETMDLTAHTDKLALGKNILAVEVHQVTTNDTDMIWDAELVYSLSANIEPAQMTRIWREPGGGILLEWTALPGRQYFVEWSDNLTVWTPLGSPITATEPTGQGQDPSPANTNRFYRVYFVQ